MAWDYDDKFYSSVNERGTEASTVVLNYLKELFKPASVHDYGCGYGMWTKSAAKAFPRAKVIGFDLPSTIEKNQNATGGGTNLSFAPMNLETHNDEYKECDLSICLEVVEHLSFKRAELHISKMCESSNFILFSGAVNGQGGTGHINEQPLEYWVNQFEMRGWIPVDAIRPLINQNKNIPSYYRNNILLFIRSQNIEKTLQQISEGSTRDFFLRRVGCSTDERSLIEKILHFSLQKLPVSFVSRLAEIKNLLAS